MVPFKAELAQCRWPGGGCGRLVLWAVTERGRRQALDPKPVADGPVAAYRVGARSWRARSLVAEGALPCAPYEDRFVPHVVTCEKQRPVQPEIPGVAGLATVTPIGAARRRRGRRVSGV